MTVVNVYCKGCEEPGFLKHYSSKLVSIADFFKGNSNRFMIFYLHVINMTPCGMPTADSQNHQLAELCYWLEPVKELSSDETSISSLVEFIKRSR